MGVSCESPKVARMQTAKSMPVCGIPVRVYANPAPVLPPPPPLRTFQLDPDAKAKLHQGLKAVLLSPYDTSTWQTFVRRAMREMMLHLPEDVLEAMYGANNAWHSAPCAFLVRGMPVDEVLPRTPDNGRAPVGKATFLSEAGLVGLTTLAGGVVFGAATEKDGSLVHQVAPIRGKEKDLSNAGAVKLHWHSENAADPVAQQPHTVALACLRADHDGEAVTRFADVFSVLSALNASDVAALRAQDFSFTLPPARGAGVCYTDYVSILTGPQHSPSLRLTMFNPRTTAAKAVLGRLEAAIEANCTSVRLRPGDVLLLDNRRTVHSRSSFAPRFDGQDRWLQRVWARPETWEGRTAAMTRSTVYE